MNNTQNDNNAKQLSELGYPVHLFIDTSNWERMQFPFGLPRLQPLMDRLNEGDIRVVISEVVVHEIRAHVFSHIIETEKAHAKFRKKAFIIKINKDSNTQALITELDWKAINKSIFETVDSFFQTPGVEVIPIHGDDAKSVFDDYFSCRAPFGEGKKKSEFPDSFATKGLLRYAQIHKCTIGVVSEDGDWQAVCRDHDELIHCSSLEQVIDHSQIAKAEPHKEIRQLLEGHRHQLESIILESFKDRGFYWDSDADYDSDVEEIYDEEIESLSLSVVATDGNCAEVAGDACIHFRATVTYPDPDSCYRDPDTKELVFLNNVNATLISGITVMVRFSVNIESLRQNELKLSELIVADNSDIWFTEDEIEEIHTDNEYYEE